MELQTQTFQNSLQHEIQHYYDVDKSNYSWANDNTYKMAQELIAIENNKSIKDNALKERLYMLGVMFYLSFRQEQSGLTRKNIDKLSKSDESFSVIRLLRILSDVLSGLINDNKIHQAIEYINDKYQKSYTIELISKKCDKVMRDLVKRLNRAKAEALYPNDIYESKIPKMNEYMPLNFKKR